MKTLFEYVNSTENSCGNKSALLNRFIAYGDKKFQISINFPGQWKEARALVSVMTLDGDFTGIEEAEDIGIILPEPMSFFKRSKPKQREELYRIAGEFESFIEKVY